MEKYLPSKYKVHSILKVLTELLKHFFPPQVEEVIDNIESQFKDNCRSVIKGVRLTSKNCFLTVNDAKQCETILKSGLKIREKPIKLENVWEGSTILQLSAVPHYVADDQIITAVSRFADVIGIYFNVDFSSILHVGHFFFPLPIPFKYLCVKITS